MIVQPQLGFTWVISRSAWPRFATSNSNGTTVPSSTTPLSLLVSRSSIFGCGTAAVVTFVGNKYWTFRHRSGYGTARETVIFFLLNGVGALIQYACVWIAKNGFDVTGKYPLNLAFLFGIGLGTLFRFWSYRKWVWGISAREVAAEASPRSPASV